MGEGLRRMITGSRMNEAVPLVEVHEPGGAVAWIVNQEDVEAVPASGLEI